MPRGPRRDVDGFAHHVWTRGVGKTPIFLDARDAEFFLARLSIVLCDEGIRCFAWALMTNHFHLVVETRTHALSRAMARLNTSYAAYFNAAHQRVGHLFQNRFGSRSVRDDEDLCGVVVYVHANPLSARIVRSEAELRRHRWCGHGALMGTRPRRPFEGTDALPLFGSRERLAELVKARAEAEWARAALAAEDAVERELRALCATFDVDWHHLAGPRVSGMRARQRDLLLLTAVGERGLGVRQIARILEVAPSTIARAVRRAEQRTQH